MLCMLCCAVPVPVPVPVPMPVPAACHPSTGPPSTPPLPLLSSSPRLPQKERRLTGLHRDLEELLFDPGFKGAVGERSARGRGEEAGPPQTSEHLLALTTIAATTCRPAGGPQQAHPLQVPLLGSLGLLCPLCISSAAARSSRPLRSPPSSTARLPTASQRPPNCLPSTPARSMARLDKVKNLTGLAEWYGASPRLRAAANLFIVGARAGRERKGG